MVKQSPYGEREGGTTPGSWPALTATHGALLFTVRVTPRASGDALILEDGTVKARLRAAPVDGAANAALIGLLAKHLGITRSAITIARGETARTKQIAISGLAAETLRQRFAALAQSK
jgi:uncharacterized protein YggU (UPF0235/DUF167 family)